MSKSSEVVGGGTSTLAVAAPEVSAALAPVEEGGGGTAPYDASLGCEGATLKSVALCQRKVVPMEATT